jgi:hypothetical protein
MYCPALQSRGGVEGHAADGTTLKEYDKTQNLERADRHEARRVGKVKSSDHGPAVRSSGLRSGPSAPTVRNCGLRPSKPDDAPGVLAAGVEPGPREFKRPLAKDADKTISRQAPWKAEGMSRASWYRRKKAAKK